MEDYPQNLPEFEARFSSEEGPRYLYRQDPYGSGWLALVLLVSVGFGLSFYWAARGSLAGQQSIARALDETGFPPA